MRYKMIVAYDGAFFHGFQRQTSLISVQSVLEDTLTEILKTPVIIHGAGRTDALVHAYGQVVHFDSPQEVPPKNLKKILNKKIYPHIYVSDIEFVDETFHSRKSAKGKEYHYIVDIGEYDPLKNNYVLYHHNRIDIESHYGSEVIVKIVLNEVEAVKGLVLELYALVLVLKKG